jgi:hypothetical protein
MVQLLLLTWNLSHRVRDGVALSRGQATVQSRIKLTVATPPTDIIERQRRDKDDIVHPCLLVNALERLAAHEWLPLEVSATNVQPG